jgi:Ca2+-binding RTX toxin-like protein
VDAGRGDNFIANIRGNSTLIGWDGDDVIFGGIGDTLIMAGGGANRVVTGPGRDVVRFFEEPHETRILDFRRGSDRLDFSRHDGVAGLEDLTIRQIGTSAIIDDGAGGRVLLASTAASSLTAYDFLF